MNARLALLSALALVNACAAPEERDPLAFRDGSVSSSDGVPIHYREGGAGEHALVFVHGWLGDAEVWDSAMRRFAPSYRVVALDLAGHGSSGKGRSEWTVPRFADDVAAVVGELGLEHVTLVGHSMSGPITVAAANELGPRVELLVPVDTLNDVEWDLPPEVWEQFFGGLRADFPGAVSTFFRTILAAPTSPPAAIDAIVAGAQAADPVMAVAILERSRDYDVRAGLRALRAPIHAINSDLNPTRLDVNRKYAPVFEVELLPGVGHWPHLEAPEEFEQALERVLALETALQ